MLLGGMTKCSPEWNEKFKFDYSPTDPKLALVVYDEDKVLDHAMCVCAVCCYVSLCLPAACQCDCAHGVVAMGSHVVHEVR